MTFDEALRELDVDASTPPEDARRAYLRLLKTRKPEVDPEGFRRLREAYEVVRSPARAERRDVGATRGPAPFRDVAVQGERPVDASREMAASPTNEARIVALLEEGATTDAARALIATFDAGLATFAPRDEMVPIAIDTILRLQCGLALDASLALGRSVHDFLRETGAEARLVRDAYATKWAIARELDSLPREFPSEIRAPMARAALALDPTLAYDALRSSAQAEPTRAHDAAYALRDRAPLLSDWYTPLLWSVYRAAPRNPSYRAPLVAVAAVLCILLTGLSQLGSSIVSSAAKAHPPSPSASTAPSGTPAERIRAADESIDGLAEEFHLAVDRGECERARSIAREIVRAQRPAAEVDHANDLVAALCIFSDAGAP